MKKSSASKFNTLSVQDCNIYDENYAEDEITEEAEGDVEDNVNDNEKINNDDEVIQSRSNSTGE